MMILFIYIASVRAEQLKWILCIFVRGMFSFVPINVAIVIPNKYRGIGFMCQQV